MKIAYITAGAGGMFCGSCLHDNTLVAALLAQGNDALLIPTYTPIRTDEEDVSQRRVFFGGINVYLQQKLRLFRHTPWLVDRLFDVPRLLRWVSRFAVIPRAKVHVVYPGIDLRGHGGDRPEPAPGAPLTVGYFARIAPEKGLHQLVDAFIMLKQMGGAPPA